jgi:hypothetical protein
MLVVVRLAIACIIEYPACVLALWWQLANLLFEFLVNLQKDVKIR